MARHGLPVGVLVSCVLVVPAMLPTMIGQRLGATAALAQGLTEKDCAAAVTQTDMTACAREDYETADKSLNAAYRKATIRAEATDKDLADMDASMTGAVEALKSAQRAWIGYRDGHCTLEGFSARGGSLEPMLVAGCLAALTRTRTKELESVLTEP
jgi:uncharacterized protein YecT (DUF1311 family)